MAFWSLNHEDPTIFDHLVTILKLECQTAGPPLGDGGAGGGEWRAGGGARIKRFLTQNCEKTRIYPDILAKYQM